MSAVGMRTSLHRCLSIAVATALLFGLEAGASGIAPQPAAASAVGAPFVDPAGGTGSYVLTATNTGATYAPTFVGNGELGVRVPPSGQGSSDGARTTPSELAGFYAQPTGGVQLRATIPTWSTLTYSDGGEPFTLANGRTSHWRQSINLRTGVIATTARWTAPDGHVTELSYQVLTDRARPQVGLVRLELTPRWSGQAAVTDAIDGSLATMSTQLDKGWSMATHGDWVGVQAVGTGIDAAIASTVTTSGNVAATTTRTDQTVDQSVGQQLSFPVVAGHVYTFTKYVGVEMAQGADVPTRAAQAQAHDAAASGFGALLAASDRAWSALWSNRIDVLGDPSLATAVNASEFYLWSSTRDGIDWSVSPAGLSSNGYSGHIFWDAETWMYPALLAQHPDLAAGMNAYRFQRLAAAQQHAAATGYRGARYPWESAVDGTEQIPPPQSIFTEGLYEQHVTADVAIAQWQYYLATGDKEWLARQGWPVLSQTADFWASRATMAADGTFHIDGVTGPDEAHPNVNDEVYTNASAKTVLEDAAQAAHVLGLPTPATWNTVASGIVVPEDSKMGIQPEFSGYDGGMIKQADVTLLEYPLGYSLPAGTAQHDIDYYAARTNPDGPSMSDSVNSIDTSALGTAGCASFVYTQRSVEPFIRDVFDQFSETSTGGAFTFMTGIGGFLQEFVYGYSGLRWNADAVGLGPSLTGQLGGVVLHGLSWHGRRFTVMIGPRTTSVTLNSGATMPVRVGSQNRDIDPGQTLTLPTGRPDLVRTDNVARCAQATATSSRPGAPALAAVDGSQATGWQPLSATAALTVPLAHGPRTINAVTLEWHQQVPVPSNPDQAGPPGPVTTLRAASYVVAASSDGRTWKTVAQVVGRSSGATDVLHFAPILARSVSVRISAAAGAQPPILDELSVT